MRHVALDVAFELQNSRNGNSCAQPGKTISKPQFSNCMRKEVKIVNKLGLHARPAALFVRCVIRFKSTITIWKGEEKFSAASLLEVLTANLDCGAHVVIEAVGPNEQEALNKLEALLLRFRDE
jgi:phosphocarrier protein HPr